MSDRVETEISEENFTIDLDKLHERLNYAHGVATRSMAALGRAYSEEFLQALQIQASSFLLDWVEATELPREVYLLLDSLGVLCEARIQLATGERLNENTALSVAENIPSMTRWITKLGGSYMPDGFIEGPEKAKKTNE